MIKKISILSTLALASTTVLGTSTKLQSQPTQQTFSNMFVLGDSLSDTGAFVGASSQLGNNIFGFNLRRKVTFHAPLYQNSFSNGKVAVQVLADHLNIPLKAGYFYNPWLGRKINEVGNNYAFGGSQITPVSRAVSFNQLRDTLARNARAMLINGSAIDKQADLLIKQHGKLASDALVIKVIGGNELMSIVEADNGNAVESTNKITQAINVKKETLKKLIANNASRIVVGNAPNLSLTPRYLDNPKKEVAHRISTDFNRQLDDMLNNLQIKHPNKIRKFDLNQTLKAKIQEFSARGYNVTEAATKTSYSSFFKTREITPLFLGKANAENINNYAFFDEIHPTGTLHREMGNALYEVVKKPWN